MGTRRGRRRYRGHGSDLQIKEVILPDRRDLNEAGSSKSFREYNSPHRSNDASNIKKAGKQETAAFCGLVILEKPLLEDYFQGKGKKNYKRRRAKKKKLNALKEDSNVWDVPLQTNDTSQCETGAVRNISQRSKKYEENLLKRKIHNYEKQLEKEREKNYRSQRLLEKESMEKQGNLAETWLGLFQRREELKKKDLEENSTLQRCFRCNYHSRPINISLLPKKYWKDETDERRLKTSKGKEKEKQRTEKTMKSLPTLFEELEGEFTEKLVFVDDSDDDSI